MTVIPVDRTWRRRLIALVSLSVLVGVSAFALSASEAQAAWKQCPSQSSPSGFRVKKISCADGEKKVVTPYYQGLFGRGPVDWGRGCNRMDTPGHVCHFKVNGFKGTATNKTQWKIEVDCVKDRKRVNWTYDRRTIG